MFDLLKNYTLVSTQAQICHVSTSCDKMFDPIGFESLFENP
jgi:hypothetical protein